MDKYKKAKSLIDKSKYIIILTGAGMSTESGVKDFRSSDGLSHTTYEGYYPETILSRTFFYDKPQMFYDYLKEYLNVEGILPNKGHKILAELEGEKNITIVTQNIDALHQKAGSTNVIELHGNMERGSCTRCSKVKSLSQIFKEGPSCECGGLYKTDVVLYEENVPDIGEAFVRADKADLLIVLGTSLQVYPAASIPAAFGAGMKPAIVINRDKTTLSGVENVLEFNRGIGETLEKIMSAD
nr:NAD-dependent protein deacylase [Tissierella sp.]